MKHYGKTCPKTGYYIVMSYRHGGFDGRYIYPNKAWADANHQNIIES